VVETTTTFTSVTACYTYQQSLLSLLATRTNIHFCHCLLHVPTFTSVTACYTYQHSLLSLLATRTNFRITFFFKLEPFRCVLLNTQNKVQSKHNYFIVNYKCGDMFRLSQSSSGQSLKRVLRYIKQHCTFLGSQKVYKLMIV
jgi:hypothetical protein